MIRVLVTGSRHFNDTARVNAVMNRVLKKWGGIRSVIHGDAPGLDNLVKRWCHRKGIPETGNHFRARWESEGDYAGPNRNQRMVDEGRADIAIAFRGNRGTADCKRRIRAAGIELYEIP